MTFRISSSDNPDEGYNMPILFNGFNLSCIVHRMTLNDVVKMLTLFYSIRKLNQPSKVPILISSSRKVFTGLTLGEFLKSCIFDDEVLRILWEIHEKFYHVTKGLN